MVTIAEIIREYLTDYDYDGLCREDCGCGVDDLAPCGAFSPDCVPAKRIMRDGGTVYVPADED